MTNTPKIITVMLNNDTKITLKTGINLYNISVIVGNIPDSCLLSYYDEILLREIDPLSIQNM